MCTLLCLTIIEFHEICNFCCYTKISCNQNFEDSICASIMLDRLLQEWKLNITFSSSLLGVVICTYKTIADSSQFHEKTKIIKHWKCKQTADSCFIKNKIQISITLIKKRRNLLLYFWQELFKKNIWPTAGHT